MNDRFDEKKIAEEKILNDNALADVVGGVSSGETDYYFIGTFVCPLCKKEHSFKFVMGGLKIGFGYEIIEEESPCDKIEYLRTITSFDGVAHTGTLAFVAANGTWHNGVPFTVNSVFSNGEIINL